jgi:hypothetical protein
MASIAEMEQFERDQCMWSAVSARMLFRNAADQPSHDARFAAEFLWGARQLFHFQISLRTIIR